MLINLYQNFKIFSVNLPKKSLPKSGECFKTLHIHFMHAYALSTKDSFQKYTSWKL